jgi:hypothetical protein
MSHEITPEQLREQVKQRMLDACRGYVGNVSTSQWDALADLLASAERDKAHLQEKIERLKTEYTIPTCSMCATKETVVRLFQVKFETAERALRDLQEFNTKRTAELDARMLKLLHRAETAEDKVEEAERALCEIRGRGAKLVVSWIGSANASAFKARSYAYRRCANELDSLLSALPGSGVTRAAQEAEKQA